MCMHCKQGDVHVMALHVKEPERDNGLPQLQLAEIKRLSKAIENSVLRVLDKHTREFAANVRKGLQDGMAVGAATRWQQEMFEAERIPMGIISVHGARRALHETVAARSLRPVKQVDDEILIPLLASGEQVDDFLLLVGHQEPVDDWLRTVASETTKQNAKRLQEIHEEARTFLDPVTHRGIGPAQQAKQILDEGLAKNKAHARMIAITDSTWAYNEGQRNEYTSQGVTVFEWYTSQDDAVCPFCASMHGVKVAAGDPFWPGGSTFGVQQDDRLLRLNLPNDIMHPPLHPNCACTLLPVVLTEVA